MNRYAGDDAFTSALTGIEQRNADLSGYILNNTMGAKAKKDAAEAWARASRSNSRGIGDFLGGIAKGVAPFAGSLFGGAKGAGSSFGGLGDVSGGGGFGDFMGLWK